MSNLIAIEPTHPGLYLRFQHGNPATHQNFAGGVVVVDFDENQAVVGVRVVRLRSIELQILSDVARRYALNLDGLLEQQADAVAS